MTSKKKFTRATSTGEIKTVTVMQTLFRAEFHVHTRFSKDSLLPLWLLYFKCRLKKIDYVAVTEHNNIQGGLAFSRFCRKRKGKVKGIVGEEIMTQSGEIIGLYLSEEIPAGLSAAETIQRIISQNGIVYVPHPYDEKRSKTVLKESVIAEFADRIDCIECYNGRNVSSEYGKIQNEIAERYGVTKIVGSDAHTLMEIGRNAVFLKGAIDNPESFKNALGSAVFQTKKSIPFAHFVTKISKALKMLFKGDFHGLHRAIDKRHQNAV